MQRKLLALTATALLFSAPVFGEIDNADIAVCAAMKGDLDRLECYDQLARKNGLDAPQPVATDMDSTGKWEVDVTTNPIDDTRTVLMTLAADSGQSKWGNPVALIARCRSNKTEAYIAWNDYLGSSANVLTRVGDQPATNGRWGLSTDSQATFHPSAIRFLKQMMEADTMVAQVTPYNENPVTAIFDTSGMQNAIAPLRETCNW